MTLIKNDVLDSPYATFDVSVYDPLITDTYTIEALARLLAALSAGKLPPGIGQLGATAPAPGESAEQAKVVAALDTYDPSRLYKQALLRLHDMLVNEAEGGQFKKAQAEPDLNPFELDPNNPQLNGTTILKALTALRRFIEIHPNEALQGLSNDDAWKQQWDGTIAYVTQRLRSFPIRQSSSSAISVFGLLHRFRQHFLYSELRAGPLELVQALAPGEKIEVVLTESKSTTYEEAVERELEVTQSESTETRDQVELADRVASTVSKASTLTLTASGSSNAVLWSASGSASTTVSSSSAVVQEQTRKRLQDTTRKQSEEIRRKTRITTRVVETTSDSTTTRHVIENSNGEKPANYGLRRLGYNVDVKIQDLGPVLVWQSLVDRPGDALAVGELIDQLWDAEKNEFERIPVSISIIGGGFPPGRPDPVASAAEALLAEFRRRIGEKPTPDEETAFYDNEKLEVKITSVSVIEDFGSKNTPVLLDTTKNYTISSASFTSNRSVAVTLAPAPAHWYQLHATLNVVMTRKKSPPPADPDLPQTEDAAFKQRVRQTADFKAKRSRDSLEFEERKVLLAAVLSSVADARSLGGDASLRLQQLYLQINEVFDLRQMFYDVDVAEWATAIKRGTATRGMNPTYPLHSQQSEPASLGSSLGWKHQVDGDSRRDIFLNAPWAWVCIPVRLGKEQQAADLLKAQGVALSTDNALDGVLRELARLRLAERQVATNSADEGSARVTRDSNVTPDPRPWLAKKEPLPANLSWIDVYPIVGRQKVVSTVQGFVFDRIEVGDSWGDNGRDSDTPPGTQSGTVQSQAGKGQSPPAKPQGKAPAPQGSK